MHKRLALLACPVLSLLVAACGGGESEVEAGGASNAPAAGSDLPAPVTEADRYMATYIGTMNAMTDALRSVKDEESAKAAGKKIQDLAAQLNEEFAATEQLGDAEIGAAGMRYASALQKVQMELSQALMPVMMNPQYAQHVQAAMKELPKAPAGK